MCSRPAVSTMTTSLPTVARLGERALGARHRIHLAGRIVHPHARPVWPTHRQLLDGRRAPDVGRHHDRVASLLASATSRACRSSSSCPSPAGRASESRAAAPRRLASPPLASPNSASISSRTILTTCWPASGSCRTSWSIARSRTRSMNALTTLKLTSASSSASRISRSAASTVASVSRDLAANRLEDVLQALAELIEHGSRLGLSQAHPDRPAA